MDNLYEKFELGGMVDKIGTLNRVLPILEPLVDVDVALEGEGESACLIIESGRDMANEPLDLLMPGTEGMLDAFVALPDAQPGDFLKFAKKWGLLGLCFNHELPYHHDPSCKGAAVRESIAGWRRLARQARAMLRIAVDLHRYDERDPKRPLGDEADWVVLEGNITADVSRRIRGSVSLARGVLGNHVHRFLEIGGIEVQFVWYHERPSISLTGEYLFAIVATQLAFAVARSEGLAICVACGRPYSPTRRPAKGRRNYCDPCRTDGVPQRHASRDYWSKPGRSRGKRTNRTVQIDRK